MNDQGLDNKKAKCLECHAEVQINSAVISGEVVTCPECSTDLEILATNPVKLTLAPTAQEDWGQ